MMNRQLILMVIAVATTMCALPSEGKLQFLCLFIYVFIYSQRQI